MKYLKELNITQSFSRPHIPYDNSVVESFFKYLKAEELYRIKYKSEREFKESLARYRHSIIQSDLIQLLNIGHLTNGKVSIEIKIIVHNRTVLYTNPQIEIKIFQNFTRHEKLVR